MRRPRRPSHAALALLALLCPLALTAQTPVELDTLRVHVGARAPGALPALTRATHVLDRAALAAAPVRSVAEALAWAVGADLHARSPAQADLALRGSTFEQVLVLVDGVRVSDAQTGHFDLDLAVPLAEVERIEVLLGPATAAYGTDAMGGVVNIVTRGGTTATAAAEGGSFGQLGVALAGGLAVGPGGAVRLAVEGRRADGHRPGTDYDILQARLSGGVPLGAHRLTGALGYAARDFGARAFYTPATAPFDEYEETRTLSAAVGVEADQRAAFTLEPRLSARRHDDEFLLRRQDPDFYRNVHEGWQLGAEVVARWRGAGPSLAAGAEGWLDRLESSALGEREERRGAVWAEAALGRRGRALLTTGVRLDAHETFGSFLAPSVSAAWWLGPALRLRGAAGRAFRAPSWTDRYYSDPASVGNPDLDPETSWEVDGGIVWTGATVELSAGAFFRRTDDAIDWARPVGAAPEEPWRTRNVERTDVVGVEVEGRAALAGGTVRAAFTALDQDSRDAAGFTSRYALRPLTRTALVAIQRPLGRLLSLDARVHHARRAGEAGAAVADGACVAGRESAGTRADARLTATWPRWRLYADALNLADARVCEPSAVFAPARSFVVGVSVGG